MPLSDAQPYACLQELPRRFHNKKAMLAKEKRASINPNGLFIQSKNNLYANRTIPSIEDESKQQFEQLQQGFLANTIAAVDCIVKDTGQQAILLVSVETTNGIRHFTPVAQLLPGADIKTRYTAVTLYNRNL